MSSIVPSDRLAQLQKGVPRSGFALSLVEFLITGVGEKHRDLLMSAAATPLIDRYLSAALALQNATVMHDSALEAMRESQKKGELGTIEQATAYAAAAIVYRDGMYPEKVADAAIEYRDALATTLAIARSRHG